MNLKTSKSPTPVAGDLFYAPTAHRIEMFDVTSGAWKIVMTGRVSEDTKCLLCGWREYGHPTYYSHPFIKDNLDYLAWKYEQKKPLTSK